MSLVNPDEENIIDVGRGTGMIDILVEKLINPVRLRN